MSPIKRGPVEWAIRAAVAALFLFLAIGFVRGPIAHIWRKPARNELDALRAEGDAILRSLAEYHANHRRYPSELPTSPQSSHGAKYGGWRYACIEADCTTFKLAVGHYADYSFEIHWRPDTKTWYTDT